MDEFSVQMHFEPQLPCVVCGKPATCGFAFNADLQGLSHRDLQGTWVIYPFCEENLECRRALEKWIQQAPALDSFQMK